MGIEVECTAERTTGKNSTTRTWYLPALIAAGLLLVLTLLAGCQSTPPRHGLTAEQIAALKEAGIALETVTSVQ